MSLWAAADSTRRDGCSRLDVKKYGVIKTPQNIAHLIEHNSKGGKQEACDLWAVDWFRTEGTLAEVVENVAQALRPMIQVPTPVVLADEESGRLACPSDHLEQLVCNKGTRSRRSRWIQSVKDVRHDRGMRVVCLNEVVEFGACVKNLRHLMQKIRGPVVCGGFGKAW